MGKFTYHGWATSADDIPQATSIIFGRNLRQSSEKTADKQTQKPKPQASKKVLHGASSPQPLYPTMSLAEARELGLATDPVLIVSPSPNESSKPLRRK